MLRRKIGTSLAACGIVMLMFGLSALPAQGAAPSPVRLAPSPRPALAPINRSSGGPLPNGHITGTVIDLNTGAPAVGVAVNVGGAIVQTDANGNYDHWLPIGTYTVTLALANGQGTPAQETLTVPVQADAATVQHLNFRGQAAAAPTPVAVQPAPKPQAAAPVAAPAADAPAADAPAADAPAAEAPKRLPRTSSEGYTGWSWLALGMVLLLAGGLVGFGPVMGGRSPAMVLRTHAANSALLRALLAAPVRPARPAVQRDELLEALLEIDRSPRRSDRS